MLQHDRERLENVYPGGIPEAVQEAVSRYQKIHHAHFGTGPVSGEMLTLICLIYGGQDKPQNEVPVVARQEEEEPVQEEESAPEPKIDEPVNWYSVKNGTPLICETDNGMVEGSLFGVFRKGPDKGLLKVDIATSENEFDVFHPSKVRIKK